MTRFFALAITAGILALAAGITPGEAASDETKGKTCHLEQQCHWENFKKICTWVKVCR
jgi:hypothetical protein